MILSCINPCIKTSFYRSVFSPLRCHFYHVASCWASTFIFFSSQAHTLLQRPSHISGDKTV
ncbi:hypothetical protein G3C57_003172 [Salmonella enterica]|nr:hypothetical protein [Salmonella enterica]EBS0658217.1 hypothetical protein [Salmonella enterica subsp. enterica serovar Kintambo]EDT2776659.1 hypothetical protein [Salmonella enterica subsp. enterica]EAO6614131.1 hypothetical protein [Salmonella enterica]EAP9185031.1 hypothetical protein [Salmonella enterica]